jgi:beta propeller repeat protein
MIVQHIRKRKLTVIIIALIIFSIILSSLSFNDRIKSEQKSHNVLNVVNDSTESSTNISFNHYGPVTEIIFKTGYQRYISIHDDYLLWTDLKKPYPIEKIENVEQYFVFTNDVYLYNLRTLEEFQITNDSNEKTNPIMNDNMIAWNERPVKADTVELPAIFYYDLRTHNEIRVTDNNKSYYLLDIWEDLIIYFSFKQDVEGAWVEEGFFLYNTTSGKTTEIFKNDDLKICCLDKFGEYIVYALFIENSQNNNLNNYDIYVYNIKNNITIPISTNEFNQSFPQIYGDIVVWEDDRHDEKKTDIYMYNLKTKTETRITNNNATNLQPRIFQDQIVYYMHTKPVMYMWNDTYTGGENAFGVYNISSGENYTIYGIRDFDHLQSFQDNRIAYDIYGERGIGIVDLTVDSDSDSSLDIIDDDDDNDGYSDITEISYNYDPFDNLSVPPDLDNDFILDWYDEDMDGDGVPNIDDVYPEDPEKWEVPQHKPDFDVKTLPFFCSLFYGLIIIFIFMAAVSIITVWLFLYKEKRKKKS